MVDSKSKTSLIRHNIIQKINITLEDYNNIILLLCTRMILFSSFVIYFFCICHSGSFPIIVEKFFKINIILCRHYCIGLVPTGKIFHIGSKCIIGLHNILVCILLLEVTVFCSCNTGSTITLYTVNVFLARDLLRFLFLE